MLAPSPAIRIVIALAATLLVTQSAAASDFDSLVKQGPGALLAETDKRLNHYDTQQWRLKMTVAPKGGEAKFMELKVWQKGSKRLVRFVAPGPVKGLSMLTRGKKTMYVYSPQTDNVRRVATHAQKQTMLGSNMTYADMNAGDLSAVYDAKLDTATATHQWLVLTKKADADAAFDTLRVRIDKAKLMVDQIEYIEDSKPVRVQRRSRYEQLGGAPAYRQVEMESVDSGLVTRIEMLEQTVNAPLDNALFKKKNLVRGL